MADSDDGFVSRWSKRKRAAREPAPAGKPEPTPLTKSEPAVPAEEPDILAQLPDIDSLTAQSDFTAFLREGVPEAIRRKALRKLWRLNPVLANLDGLNDYDGDYTDAATVIEGLKTLYRAGQGIVEDVEAKAEPEAAATEAPAAPAPGASARSEAEPDPGPAQADLRAAPDSEAALAPPTAGCSPEGTRPAARKARVGVGRSARARRWGDAPS
jgi:hypothetical protein